MKPKKIKRLAKITTGVILFFTLPSLLFFGYLYFKHNEDLPQGIQGSEADAIAHRMLESLNYEAYKQTTDIEWTFKNRRHYIWDKEQNICSVHWKDFKVVLHLNFPDRSKAYIHSFDVLDEQRDELVSKALKYFNNDSFWLVAPYKIFDPGVERRSVTLENGDKALLVTYTSGGNTPGDSYLWQFDTTGKPISFKMWTSLLPIDGLEASWSDWTTTVTGAQLPTFHKLLFMGLEIKNIKGTR